MVAMHQLLLFSFACVQEQASNLIAHCSSTYLCPYVR